MERTLDSYLKEKLTTSKDMNVRQLHTMSFVDLQYLRANLEGRADIDPHVRRKNNLCW